MSSVDRVDFDSSICAYTATGAGEAVEKGHIARSVVEADSFPRRTLTDGTYLAAPGQEGRGGEGIKRWCPL